MKAVCAGVWDARNDAAAALAAVTGESEVDIRTLSDADLHVREDREAAFVVARTRLQEAVSALPSACITHMCRTHHGVAMATTLDNHLQRMASGGFSDTQGCSMCKHAPATLERIRPSLSCTRACACDVKLCEACWTTHVDEAHTAAVDAWRNADAETYPEDDVCIVTCPMCTGKICMMTMGARRRNIRASAPAFHAPVPIPPPPPIASTALANALAPASVPVHDLATAAACAAVEVARDAAQRAYSASMGLSATTTVAVAHSLDLVDDDGEEFHIVSPEVPVAEVELIASGAAAAPTEDVVFVVDDSRLDSIPPDYQVKFTDTMAELKKMRLLISDVCKRAEENSLAYSTHGVRKLASDAQSSSRSRRRRDAGPRTFSCSICHVKNKHYKNGCPQRKKDDGA